MRMMPKINGTPENSPRGSLHYGSVPCVPTVVRRLIDFHDAVAAHFFASLEIFIPVRQRLLPRYEFRFHLLHVRIQVGTDAGYFRLLVLRQVYAREWYLCDRQNLFICFLLQPCVEFAGEAALRIFVRNLRYDNAVIRSQRRAILFTVAAAWHIQPFLRMVVFIDILPQDAFRPLLSSSAPSVEYR